MLVVKMRSLRKGIVVEDMAYIGSNASLAHCFHSFILSLIQSERGGRNVMAAIQECVARGTSSLVHGIATSNEAMKNIKKVDPTQESLESVPKF